MTVTFIAPEVEREVRITLTESEARALCLIVGKTNPSSLSSYGSSTAPLKISQDAIHTVVYGLYDALEHAGLGYGA